MTDATAGVPGRAARLPSRPVVVRQEAPLGSTESGGNAPRRSAQTPSVESQSVESPSVESRYTAMQQTPEFQDLRRRYRNWVLPVAVGSLVWYFVYVLLAAYAPGFMGRSVLGNINVGLVLGLLQFVSTFGVTALYVRYADTVLDPASSRIRDEFEGGRR